MRIKKIKCSLFEYEVGINDVASIKLTDHGTDNLTIYEIRNSNNEFIVFAGMIVPHQIEYYQMQFKQLNIFEV